MRSTKRRFLTFWLQPNINKKQRWGSTYTCRVLYIREMCDCINWGFVNTQWCVFPYSCWRGRSTVEWVVSIWLTWPCSSERSSTAQISREKLNEGASINRSLHTLGKVVSLLSDRSTGKPRRRKVYTLTKSAVSSVTRTKLNLICGIIFHYFS